MECIIEVDAKLTLTVDGVAHPVHAINRMKKYLRENRFTLTADTRFGYHPFGDISIDLDLEDVANKLDVDTHIVSPSTWMDKGEIEQLSKVLWMLDEDVANKVTRLIEEHNSV